MTLVLGRYETGLFTTDVNNKDLFILAKILLNNTEALHKHIKYFGKASVDNFIKTYKN